MTSSRTGAASPAKVQQLYEEAVAAYGPALKRLSRAYESDSERRRDLLQDIHMALWESLGRFDGRCTLGTWVYRVAHNTATSKCIRKRSDRGQLVSIEDIDLRDQSPNPERAVDEQRALERVMALAQQLQPLDRQVLLLYLEGLDAQAAGEVVGLSAANVATKIHRIKKVLVQRFHEGGNR